MKLKNVTDGSQQGGLEVYRKVFLHQNLLRIGEGSGKICHIGRLQDSMYVNTAELTCSISIIGPISNYSCIHSSERDSHTDFKMQMQLLFIALMVICLSQAIPLPIEQEQNSALRNAFEDRATVESIIQCFVGKNPCTPQEKKIKERAQATMRNLGRCPDSYCTPEERAEINLAMELLERKHPDLWLRLIGSMFGIDLGRK
ncbi:hypothetical protein SK128_025027 [Halocaridina rubra]|uniref:Uncharacterized protein n=1 Tax=Halocaridina rubra TaxID=373956 RepID=A0AAN8WHB4_HALRR